MTQAQRTQSKAVMAGTAAGLRHLDRVYVSKVNAMIAQDRTDVVQELAADHARVLHASAPDLEQDETGHPVTRAVRRIFSAA